MKKSESIIELAKALSKFQGEVKQPVKDGTNPHFKSNYVTLQGTVEAITKAAAPNGLSFMQFPINEENRIGVYTFILHSSGEWIESDPVFATPMKQDAQAAGSVITYLKRYSLSAAFGIASDLDDDGEASMDRVIPQKKYQPNQQYQPKQQQVNTTVLPTTHSTSNSVRMISEGQIKAIGAKTSNVASKNNSKAEDEYSKALVFCDIKPGTNRKDLTLAEAIKLIGYLATLEQQ